MARVTRWLRNHLRVEVNMAKTKVCRPNDVKYLGFSFYLNNKGVWRPKPISNLLTSSRRNCIVKLFVLNAVLLHIVFPGSILLFVVGLTISEYAI